MGPVLKFEETRIAPCGMNCGTCIAFLRHRNKCYGCRTDASDKLKTRLLCSIKNCVHLKNSNLKFCYECELFPCRRLKQIDKRYRLKYRTSFIENLMLIKEKGIMNFLAFESVRRSCPHCGSTLSVHRDNCLSCNFDLTKLNG